MTAERRLAKLETALSPTELVLRWLDEAHAFDDLEAYTRWLLDQPPEVFPADRLAHEAADGMRASLRGRPKEEVDNAVRKALREVLGSLTPREREEEDERLRLSREVPELRAARLDELIRTMRLVAAIVGERVGRSPDDPAVLAFAGAFIGVAMSTMLCAGQNPVAKTYQQFDDALALLEAGLPL